jgi:formate dehydrogenase
VARVLCVLYADPERGYPAVYARDGIPRIELYSDGQNIPSPTAIDFTPGELLGDVTGAFGLRKFLATRGHSLTPYYLIRTRRPGDSIRRCERRKSSFSQACSPVRLSAERIANAHNLRLVIIAGEGAEDINLDAAATRDITWRRLLTHPPSVPQSTRLC